MDYLSNINPKMGVLRGMEPPRERRGAFTRPASRRRRLVLRFDARGLLAGHRQPLPLAEQALNATDVLRNPCRACATADPRGSARFALATVASLICQTSHL